MEGGGGGPGAASHRRSVAASRRRRGPFPRLGRHPHVQVTDEDIFSPRIDLPHLVPVLLNPSMGVRLLYSVGFDLDFCASFFVVRARLIQNSREIVKNEITQRSTKTIQRKC